VKNALAYEWVRVRSLRSTWLLLVGAGVLQFASGLYWGLKRDLGTLDAFTSAFGLVDRLGAVLVAVLGITAFGLEHQHGTLATTRLVLRSPARIVAARALVTAGLGLLAGLLMVVLTAAGVLTGGGALPAGAGAAGRAVAAVLLLTVLSGLAGVALGGLLRHTGLAVGVFAVWAFVAETTLAALADVPVTALPFSGTALFAAPGITSFAVLVAAGLGATTFTLARRAG
jgi:ABC-2 type transport system permease protein